MFASPSPRGWLPQAGLALAGIVAVLALGFATAHSATDHALEIGVVQAFNAHFTGMTRSLVRAIYLALEPGWAVLVVIAIAALLGRARRSWALFFTFGASVAATWIPVIFVKMLVQKPRPDAALLSHPIAIPTNDYSFPSGHTAFVTALLLMLVFATRARWAYALLPAGMLGIAYVVLTQGVHYPTDVLASMIWVLTLGPAVWSAASAVVSAAATSAAAARRIPARRALTLTSRSKTAGSEALGESWNLPAAR